MNVNDCCPFVLKEDICLVIPARIKSRFRFEEYLAIEIPLTAVDQENYRYHFIPDGADLPEDLVILLSAGVIMPAMAMVIERIDLFQKRAWAKLA